VIADLHAHYAMHLVPDGKGTVELAATARGRRRRRDRLRALLVGFASRFANYRSFGSGPRVTLSSLREGGVGVVLSPLYSPFDEVDLDEPYGAKPENDYIDSILSQADLVEQNLAEAHGSTAALARNPREIDAARDEGKIAFVHAVEGGFHLGGTPEAVDGAVTRLAERGVAYITVAHLFWRSVATNANAIPFLPDWLYRLVFRQPARGLTGLGVAAVSAMVRERVLVDVAHMSARALDETLTLLDRLDPDKQVPVVATHAGYRFGRQEYMLDSAAIARIAARGGVVGLIFAEHQILDGLRRRRTTTFEESVDTLSRHVDRIREITGSHRHTAIGSDFDGFIKPTLAGLQSMSDMAPLERALIERYGEGDAELITSGNALRLLRSGWGRELPRGRQTALA
jgi:microsomal dipeptidase-like Zn-dependent dipeptidase